MLAVKNVNAAQLVPVLRPLMPQNAQLSAVTGANILIISDRASNVNRMMRIIARIDQVGNPDIDVIPLQSATAADTARVLNSLLAQSGEAAAASRSSPTIAPTASSSAAIRRVRLRVKTLIAHLDTPVDTGSDTQVRYLRYSDAEDLATRLKEQMSGTARARARPWPAARRSQSAQPQPNAQGNTGRRAARPSRRQRRGPARSRWPAARPPSGPTRTPTRWSSPPASARMRALNAVIDKLDIRRPQVWCEAIIAEVTVDKTADLGINWAVDGSNTNVGVGGFISPVGGTSIIDLYNDVTRAAAHPRPSQPVQPTGTTVGIGRLKASGVNFALMLRALQGDSRTNIIAHPVGGHARQPGSQDGSGAGSAVPDRPVLDHQRHRQRLPDHPARGGRHAS